jgi:hypothetical protein
MAILAEPVAGTSLLMIVGSRHGWLGALCSDHTELAILHEWSHSISMCGSLLLRISLTMRKSKGSSPDLAPAKATIMTINGEINYITLPGNISAVIVYGPRDVPSTSRRSDSVVHCFQACVRRSRRGNLFLVLRFLPPHVADEEMRMNIPIIQSLPHLHKKKDLLLFL